MKSQPPKLDILYIITQGNWGGAQRYVADLALALAPKNQVMVAVGQPSGTQTLLGQAQSANVPTHIFEHLMRQISPWHDVAAVFELANFYKAMAPKVVHLNSSKAGIIGSLAALLIAKPKRPRIIYTAHGWVFKEPLFWPIKKLYFYLEKWTAHLKDTIIVTSPDEAQIATVELKISPSKIKIISIGIESPHFLEPKEARKKLLALTSHAPKHTVPWRVTIANFYATKGLDILLQAIARTKNPAEYWLIGEGEQKSALQKQATQLKLTNVHFVGTVQNAATLLTAFDGFVLPSRKEGVPYVILEALAAKLPIIATRVGGLPSLAKTYPITLVAPSSVTELAAALDIFPTKKNNTAVPKLSTMVQETLQNYHG